MGDVVLARAKSVIDLVAADAKYHSHCYSRYFFVNLSDKSRVHTQDNEKQNAFDKLMNANTLLQDLTKRLMKNAGMRIVEKIIHSKLPTDKACDVKAE